MLPRLFTNPAAAGAYWARKRNRISTALIDDLAAPAWGTITFPSNPANLDTITIAGTVITFVTGTPGAGQAKIGANLAATISATLVYLTAHPISTARVSGSGNGLLILSATPADTSVTLAASAATVSHATLQRQKVNARVAL